MISILMAAYNGEAYIAEQIDSIFAGNFSDFTLHINDDGSTDGTVAIIEKYAEKFPGKVILTQSPQNSGGATQNFLEMMATHQDDYIMLCDQDDIWLPDKIEKTLAKMKEMEAKYPSTPLLVHTDLAVVDHNLNVLHHSYKYSTARNFDRRLENQVLTLNNVSGCTIMYNRALAALLTRKPEYCMVHDWWLQIVAAYLGKIGYIRDSTILYRQHGGNEIGAKNVRSIGYKLRQLRNIGFIKARINSTYPQAESFLSLFREKLQPPQIELLEKFTAMPKMGKLRKLYTIFKYRLFMDGFSRNIAFLLFS